MLLLKSAKQAEVLKTEEVSLQSNALVSGMLHLSILDDVVK